MVKAGRFELGSTLVQTLTSHGLKDYDTAPVVSSVGIWLLLALSIWAALHAARLDLPLAAAWTVLAFQGLGLSVR